MEETAIELVSPSLLPLGPHRPLAANVLRAELSFAAAASKTAATFFAFENKWLQCCCCIAISRSQAPAASSNCNRATRIPSAASPLSVDLKIKEASDDDDMAVLMRSSGNMTRHAAIAELASVSKNRASS